MEVGRWRWEDGGGKMEVGRCRWEDAGGKMEVGRCRWEASAPSHKDYRLQLMPLPVLRQFDFCCCVWLQVTWFGSVWAGIYNPARSLIPPFSSSFAPSLPSLTLDT